MRIFTEAVLAAAAASAALSIGAAVAQAECR